MISFKEYVKRVDEAQKGNTYNYETNSGAKGLAHKVGDSVWAKHHMKNESYDYDSWHNETMKKHLDQYHSHLSPEKHKEISQHFAKKKKVDLIGSQDELGIPVGSVKNIWNHLKDARKSSFGSTHDSESKGTKLNRALGQQKAGMIRK